MTLLLGTADSEGLRRLDVYDAHGGKRARPLQRHIIPGICPPTSNFAHLAQNYSVRGTTSSPPKMILTDGYRLVSDRKESHLVGGSYSDWQHLRLKIANRGKNMASPSSGYPIRKLDNDGVVSPGAASFVRQSEIFTALPSSDQRLHMADLAAPTPSRPPTATPVVSSIP